MMMAPPITFSVACLWSLLLATTLSLSTAFSPRGFTKRYSSSSTCLEAFKVTLRMAGKKQSNWISEGCSMYEKRLRSAGWDIETVYHKTDAALMQGVDTDCGKQVPIVLLDIDEGKSYTSEALAKCVYEWIEEGGSRVCFVIGGGEELLWSRSFELITAHTPF